MTDFTDPNNWTKEYVRSHRRECLTNLKEVNLLAIRYVQQNQYAAAIAGLDRILNGLVTMQNSNCGDYWSIMSMFSMANGILLTFLGPQGIPNAIKALKDAKDFARKPETKKNIDAILAPLQAGKPVDARPSDVVELMQMVGPKLTDAMYDSDPSPTRSVSPSRPAASPTRSVSSLAVGPADPEFEKWVEDNDLDDEDLEWLYKRLRFRRNLYGLCLLGGPLGILILPFWLRAAHLTKSIRYRNFSVKPSPLVYLVTMFFGLPTLYIYPWIMGKIIVATNWGMGFGDRRAWIPIIATILLIAGIVVVPAVRSLVPAPSEVRSPASTSEPSRNKPADRTALSVGEFERVLSGEWSNARRREELIFITYYGFPAKGEIQIWDHDYMNVYMTPYPDEFGDEYGWMDGPRGYATFFGDYAMTASEDGRFTLTADGAYDVDSENPFQLTCELAYVDDDTILIDGETYIRGVNYTLVEFAERFSFSLEAEYVVDD